MLSKIVKVYCKREEGTKIGGGKRKRGKRNGVKVGWENRAEGGGGKWGGERPRYKNKKQEREAFMGL